MKTISKILVISLFLPLFGCGGGGGGGGGPEGSNVELTPQERLLAQCSVVAALLDAAIATMDSQGNNGYAKISSGGTTVFESDPALIFSGPGINYNDPGQPLNRLEAVMAYSGPAYIASFYLYLPQLVEANRDTNGFCFPTNATPNIATASGYLEFSNQPTVAQTYVYLTLPGNGTKFTQTGSTVVGEALFISNYNNSGNSYFFLKEDDVPFVDQGMGSVALYSLLYGYRNPVFEDPPSP